MNKLFFLLALVCWMGCSSSDELGFTPGSGSSNGGTSPSIMDYSGLTSSNHPRVIFTDEDFAEIVSMVNAGTNSALTSIHNQILDKAGSYVGIADLERTLTGKRLLDVSRSALQRILYCAYAYKTTGVESYLQQAENDLKTVCAFSDWNAGQHFLDVGEMAAAVGLGYDWLYNDLSSSTKSAIRTALNDFAFTPANNGVWNLNFYESESNWNQVCNGGLVCAALAVYEDNESVAAGIIDKAVESNATVMAALYSPDGNYPEGYSYWRYGTIYQALMLTALETAVGYDGGLSSTEGFSQTGKYMVFMEGPTGMCFNYSDCAQAYEPCLAQWYFAWKFNDLSVLYLEQNRIDTYSSSEEMRLLPLLIYYAARISISDISAPTENIFMGEGITPVVLIHDTWTMDSNDKFLGVKGGKGSTSHAHLDAGTFVYDAFGTRWASDLGLQSYTGLENTLGQGIWTMTDGSVRWQVFRYNNFNHNTITVNDAYHSVDGEAVITGLVNSFGQQGAVVDITAPLKNEVSSAVRTIYMEGDDLVIEDRITALNSKSAEVRWTLVTQAVPTIEYGSITLNRSGKYMYLTKSSSTGHNPSWATWSAQSENSWDASNTGYYECGYEITLSPGTSATITIRMTPDDPLE